MYNRYIPGEAGFVRVPEEDTPPQHPQSEPPQSLHRLGETVSGLLRSLRLEKLDTGDLLLALIMLLILLEDGDDLDVVITLGLMLLLGLGEP